MGVPDSHDPVNAASLDTMSQGLLPGVTQLSVDYREGVSGSDQGMSLYAALEAGDRMLGPCGHCLTVARM
jgi:hypothetical protein